MSLVLFFIFFSCVERSLLDIGQLGPSNASNHTILHLIGAIIDHALQTGRALFAVCFVFRAVSANHRCSNHFVPSGLKLNRMLAYIF